MCGNFSINYKVCFAKNKQLIFELIENIFRCYELKYYLNDNTRRNSNT